MEPLIQDTLKYKHLNEQDIFAARLCTSSPLKSGHLTNKDTTVSRVSGLEMSHCTYCICRNTDVIPTGGDVL